MEFRQSRLMFPEPYDASDLHGTVPLRRHMRPLLEDIGTVRCQEDWSNNVGTLNNYAGGLAARASLMQVCVPECLADRLEIISYANELAFLYDDATENVSPTQLVQQNDSFEEGFKQHADGTTTNVKATGLKALQARMFAEMKHIDEPRAIEAMRAWSIFLHDAAGRRHHEHFDSVEEYQAYRLMDVGEMYWYGVVTFGMGLTIPEDEKERCHQLAKPAYICLGLQNDLYSWEKEYASAIASGQSHVINVLYVLMQQNSCTVDEAKLQCRQAIKDYMRTYEKVVEDAWKDSTLSSDVKKYLESLLYSLSGNAWWSAICPRYNENESFSQLQSDMMAYGVERGLRRHGLSSDGTIQQQEDHFKPRETGLPVILASL